MQSSASTPIPSHRKRDQGLPVHDRHGGLAGQAAQRRQDGPHQQRAAQTCACKRRTLCGRARAGAANHRRWGSLRKSMEWERIVALGVGNDQNLSRLPPRYSDSHRKEMDLPPSVHPELGPGSLIRALRSSNLILTERGRNVSDLASRLFSF